LGENADQILRGFKILRVVARFPGAAGQASSDAGIWSAGEPQVLTINTSRDLPLSIRELAIRYAAVTGQREWKSRGGGAPRLVLTPGQNY
jgi:hypothetical protein